MRDDGGDQHHADEPQGPLVVQEGLADGAQPVGVVVELAGAEEDLQVAEHVDDQVAAA